MKKILFLMTAALMIIGCSSDADNNNSDEGEQIDFHFDKKEITATYGEDLLIELMGIAPSKCNISSSDEFLLDVSNNNDKIKIVPHYAGNALVIAEYKNVKDTCNVKVKPTLSYAEEPILTLGTSRSEVKKQMSQYQHSGTVGGYTGEDYFFNTKSKVCYQFDTNDKLIAIKQELTKSSYGINRVKEGLSQRYKQTSHSNNVYWYSHPNIMTVRVEEQVSKVYVWFAKDAVIMEQCYPW